MAYNFVRTCGISKRHNPYSTLMASIWKLSFSVRWGQLPVINEKLRWQKIEKLEIGSGWMRKTKKVAPCRKRSSWVMSIMQWRPLVVRALQRSLHNGRHDDRLSENPARSSVVELAAGQHEKGRVVRRSIFSGTSGADATASHNAQADRRCANAETEAAARAMVDNTERVYTTHCTAIRTRRWSGGHPVGGRAICTKAKVLYEVRLNCCDLHTTSGRR